MFATAAYDSADLRPQRRSHKKSRDGCTRCKQQRWKCDERRPKCTRCARARTGPACIYSCEPETGKPMTAGTKTAQTIIARPAERPKTSPVDDAVVSRQTEIVVFGTAGPMRADAMVPWRPTAFTPNPHGTPPAWDGTQVEQMHLLAHRVITDTYRDGHLLNAGGYMRPILVKLSFISDTVRHAYLGEILQDLGKRNMSPAQTRLSDLYRLKAITLLQRDLEVFDRKNAESVLATTICLMTSAFNAKEYQSLHDGFKTINKAILSLTGSSPFGLPSGTGFRVNRILLSSNEATSLLSYIKLELVRFKTSIRLDEEPGLLPAVENLENVLTDLEKKSKSNGIHEENTKWRNAMTMSSFLPPSTLIGGWGSFKPPVLAAALFYMVVVLASKVLSCKDEDADAGHLIHAAQCTLRCQQRLCDDGDLVCAGAVQGICKLLHMFLDRGTMRPPLSIQF